MSNGELVTLSFQLEALRFHVAEYLTTHVEQWRDQITAIVEKVVTMEALDGRIRELVAREVDNSIHKMVQSATRSSVEGYYGQMVRKMVEARVRRHYEKLTDPDGDPEVEEWPQRCGNCRHWIGYAHKTEGECGIIESRQGGQLACPPWAICRRWEPQR